MGNIDLTLGDLAAGRVSLANINKILVAATAAQKKATGGDPSGAGEGATSELESHRSMLNDLISDWDDDAEAALFDSLLDLANVQAGNDRKKAKSAEAAISKILDVASDAANDLAQLVFVDTNHSLKSSLETSSNESQVEAMSLLDEFFRKFVG